MRLGLAVLILYCRDCQVGDAAHLHTERALSCVRGSQTFDRSSQLHYLSGFALKSEVQVRNLFSQTLETFLRHQHLQK